ncbi:four helix bundle protein [Balneola sp. EhC07]|nr:four helix bundle protein [Balneola sp. EhC07]
MMDYKSWIRQIDENFTKDPSWKMEVYRISLYLSDLCWVDTSLILEKRIFSLADQLYRSVGSISANIIEGYSRFSNKEKARFYEIALGSAREAKDWYFKSRHILGEEVYQNRIRILTSIIKLLNVMIVDRRKVAK